MLAAARAIGKDPIRMSVCRNILLAFSFVE
jgi:hypothetical protein